MIKARSQHDALRLANALRDAYHGEDEIAITANDLYYLVKNNRESEASDMLRGILDQRRNAAEWEAYVVSLDRMLAEQDERAAALAAAAEHARGRLDAR